MPLIRAIIAATSDDALNAFQNNVIPQGGAILNMWGSAVTKTDAIGLLIGTRQLIPTGTNMNIESSADVIDTDRDQLLFNEIVEAGKLFLPVTAITTELQILIHWRALRPPV